MCRLQSECFIKETDATCNIASNFLFQLCGPTLINVQNMNNTLLGRKCFSYIAEEFSTLTINVLWVELKISGNEKAILVSNASILKWLGGKYVSIRFLIRIQGISGL